mmetsp:Transcript_36847/g.78571  ORF Transcript_36847/g.78571 Transcript_36847/m.78571 type:complete len:256 (-) Transcript_36847:300-1067(-)
MFAGELELTGMGRANDLGAVELGLPGSEVLRERVLDSWSIYPFEQDEVLGMELIERVEYFGFRHSGSQWSRSCLRPHREERQRGGGSSSGRRAVRHHISGLDPKTPQVARPTLDERERLAVRRGHALRVPRVEEEGLVGGLRLEALDDGGPVLPGGQELVVEPHARHLQRGLDGDGGHRVDRLEVRHINWRHDGEPGPLKLLCVAGEFLDGLGQLSVVTFVATDRMSSRKVHDLGPSEKVRDRLTAGLQRILDPD